jgi:hypothetical protein
MLKVFYTLVIISLITGCGNKPKVIELGPIDKVPASVATSFTFMKLPKSSSEIYFYDESSQNDLGPNPYTTYLKFKCNLLEVEEWIKANFKKTEKSRFKSKEDLTNGAISSHKWYDYFNSPSGYQWKKDESYLHIVFDEKKEILYLFDGN